MRIVSHGKSPFLIGKLVNHLQIGHGFHGKLLVITRGYPFSCCLPFPKIPWLIPLTVPLRLRPKRSRNHGTLAHLSLAAVGRPQQHRGKRAFHASEQVRLQVEQLFSKKWGAQFWVFINLCSYTII